MSTTDMDGTIPRCRWPLDKVEADPAGNRVHDGHVGADGALFSFRVETPGLPQHALRLED